MKFGCAVPFAAFGGRVTPLTEAFGGLRGVLSFCGEHFDTVELRTVNAAATAESVLSAARLCHSFGLAVTVHGALAEDTDAFFAPYLALFASGLQEIYNITLHPRADLARTETELFDICRRIEECGYPAYITLENQRMKNGNATGVCADVADIVRRIASPYLGVCFDFGHSLSNERNFETDAPKEDFYPLVRHTHIHSRANGKTHFPLDVGEALLERNFEALYAVGYDGVFSLELSAERFCEQYDVRDAFIASAQILRRAALLALQKRTARAALASYDELAPCVRHRLEEWERAIGLLGPAAYLVKLGNTRIAVDVSLSGLSVSRAGREALLSALAGVDAVIVTHAHGDHYDPALLRMLADRTLLLLPDFMESELPYTKVAAGESYTVGEATVTFFRSAHLSVPEYGFALTYRGESYVFPSDVRDYKASHAVFEGTRTLVAHLWLGKRRALVPKEETLTAFSEFLRSFGAEKIYLGHLCDVRRPIEDMWGALHRELLTPEIKAHPLTLGDVFPL